MKEVCLTPEDSIYIVVKKKIINIKQLFQQNQEEENPAIYFIGKGRVKIFSEQNNKLPILLQELRVCFIFFKLDFLLQEGDFFGERSFFTRLKRENSAISSKFTTLYMIKLEDFLKIIKENNDYVKISIFFQINKNKKGKLFDDQRKDFALK